MVRLEPGTGSPRRPGHSSCRGSDSVQRTDRSIGQANRWRVAAAGLKSALDDTFDVGAITTDNSVRDLLLSSEPDAKARAMLAALKARGAKSVFARYLEGLGGHPSADGALSAIAVTLAWGPLMRKRVSRTTAEALPWWIRLFGTLLGASVDADRHEEGRFWGMTGEDILRGRSLTGDAYVALFGLEPAPANLFAFQTLVGLLLTNGPGAISAQGAKGAVSSDGPELPERVQLNKALVGFLTHSGYAHGGNGYEGIAFLLEQFRDACLEDPTDPKHGIDLKALAMRYVYEYAQHKSNKKTAGSLDIQKIPGVNHPVFKDRPVNYDPREVYVRELFQKRSEYNVFHEYYHPLVQALFDAGVSRNVYFLTLDPVLAAP